VFVPLRAQSNYSFLEGASHPEELVEACAALGMPAIGLADRDGVYGVARAWARGRELGVKVLGGVTASVHPEVELVLLARDAGGWGDLCEGVSRAKARAPKGQARWLPEDLERMGEGVCALWRVDARAPVEEAVGWVGRVAEVFRGRQHAMLTRHGAPGERAREHATRALARGHGAPLVAAPRVLYHAATRRLVQDVLTCARLGVTLEGARGALAPNGSYGLEAPARAARRYADAPEALWAARALAAECAGPLDALTYHYPTPGGARDAHARLRDRVWRGARRRYAGEVPGDVRAQLARELELITELGYGGYFLTMHELVEFCRNQGILCQGRGSAANSSVCYCLGITAVDPVRMGLLFERFLSRERAEPPDIDLDIAHRRREEVIQHVYAEHGRRRAAMLSNAVRFRTKSAIRAVGGAFGVDGEVLDALARRCGRGEPLRGEAMEAAGLAGPAARWMPWLVEELKSTPRHMSIHPGGFLLSRDPLDRLVPIEPATMPGRTVVQWDKYDVEALGWFKVDLLGLGALTVLDDALRLVSRHEGVTLEMASLPADDPETYAMISRAETVGVFQIESRAQMSMLPRLRPRTFYDLVIEISIVRPGPIQGDMVHPYLRRREGRAPVVYPHPSLEPVLARTLGVPLFQEQVMRLAMVAAGYTAGEADQLRRDMGAWRVDGRMERHRARLTEGMAARGISEAFADRVFKQIKGFASYGFPESHAASFALIAYATAYLRCHHPEAFLCALLDAQPMGFYRPSTLVQDARRRGVRVEPVEVNVSGWGSTVEGAPGALAVRLGLGTLRGVRAEDVEALVREREARGPFEGPEDLARRAEVSGACVLALARAGAFAGVGRRRAIWRARAAVSRRRDLLALGHAAPEPALRQLGLFEEITEDLRVGRASSRGHPMGPLRRGLREAGFDASVEVARRGHGRWVRAVGVVIARQRPPTASGTMFLTLEDELGLLSVIVWPDLYDRHKGVLRGAPALEVHGRVQSADGVTHLVACHVAPFTRAQAVRWR
jgi:error-prone DNA polymerase